MSLIFWDCETCARPDVDRFKPYVKPDGRLSDATKIAADIDRRMADKAALDPYTTRLVSLAWAVDGDPVRAFMCHEERGEASAINQFFKEITDLDWEDRPQLVGYCSRIYDHHVLNTRARLLGIEIPRFLRYIPKYAKPEGPIIDLYDLCDDPCEHVIRRTLKSMCFAYGIPVPDDDIDGAGVAKAVAEGRWDDILTHNAADVERTRKLAKALGID